MRTIFDCEWAAGTETGPVRQLNQDALLAQGTIFLVADGMGGHQSGEVASQAVVDSFAASVRGEWLDVEEVHSAVRAAFTDIGNIPQATRAPAGSTVVGCGRSLQGGIPYWLVFNVGDSRAYLLSRGVFEQISVDHSRVQEMLDAGSDPDVVRATVARNVITRAIGGGSPTSPEVDMWLIRAREGDRMLLCSDGLTGELDDDELHRVLEGTETCSDAVQELIEAAMDAGAKDNVSVIVVEATSILTDVPDELEVDDTVVEYFDDDDTIPDWVEGI